MGSTAPSTDAEQAQRVRDGTKPSGKSGKPAPKASKFDSPEQEAEALRLGRKQLNSDLDSGNVPKRTASGEPNRHEVRVSTNDPDGFGSQTVRAKNPDGTNMKDANGDFVPQKNPTPLKSATVVYEYVPSTDSWEPVTYFPE